MPQIHALELVSADEAGPVVSVAEAKRHCKETTSALDADFARWIASATQDAEKELQRRLLTATFDLFLDGWCSRIELPLGAASVVSVSYYDQANALQVLPSTVYDVDVKRKPGRITLAEGQTWPILRARSNAVQIRFTAGYGDADAVPAGIKDWMLLQIGNKYHNHQTLLQGRTVSELPSLFVDGLLDPYRIVVA